MKTDDIYQMIKMEVEKILADERRRGEGSIESAKADVSRLIDSLAKLWFDEISLGEAFAERIKEKIIVKATENGFEVTIPVLGNFTTHE